MLTTGYVWRSEDDVMWSRLSFHHYVGSREQTQLARLPPHLLLSAEPPPWLLTFRVSFSKQTRGYQVTDSLSFGHLVKDLYV